MSARPIAAPQKVDLLLSGCDVVTIDGSNRVIRDGAVAEIVLEPTPDILAGLGARKTHQVLVGFAAETERLSEHAAAKMAAKRVDLLVANDVSAPDAGFDLASVLDTPEESEGEGERKTLFLSTGYLHAAFSNHRIQSLSGALQQRFAGRLPQCFQTGLVGRSRVHE